MTQVIFELIRLAAAPMTLLNYSELPNSKSNDVKKTSDDSEMATPEHLH